MTTITDLTKWRTHPQWTRQFLYLDAAPAVFQFKASNNVYPINAFAINNIQFGAYTDAEVGMLVAFGSTAGADDLGRTVVQSITSNTLKTSLLSNGTLDGEVNIPTTSFVTVYDTFPVFAKPPYIVPSGALLGTTYKDGILDFSTYGVHSPPLACINGGIGWADFIDPNTNVVTLTLSSSTSYATAPGATISSVLWDVEDGTITVGSTTTTSITATFPKGRRWVALRVTDSNGKIGWRRFLVVGCTPGRGSDWEPIRKFRCTRKITKDGQDVRVQLLQSIPTSTYLDGMVGILWEQEYAGNEEVKLYGPSGKEHVKFTGYHHLDNSSSKATPEGLRFVTEFEMQDVGARLRQLPGFPQTIERNSSPSRWEQMASANIDRYLAYLYIWHSTASNVADFIWSGVGSTYPFSTLGSDGMSLYDQINQRAKAIRYELSCDCYGILTVTPNNNRLITATQSAMGGAYSTLPVRTSTVTVDLAIGDWIEAPFIFRRDPDLGWQRGSAIVAAAVDANAVGSIGTVFCISPGATPGQGLQQADVGEQLCVNQTELNATMGHTYFDANNPVQPITIQLKQIVAIEAFSPANNAWTTLTIDALRAAWRGRTVSSSNRFLVDQVDVTYKETGYKEVKLTLRAEAIGLLSQTFIPPSAEDSGIVPVDILPSDVFTTDPPLDNTDPSIGPTPSSGWNAVALICSDGKVYQTQDFTTPSDSGGPTWTALTISGISGTPLLWVPDFFSLRNNSSTAKAYGWLITTTNIYYGNVNDPSFSSVFTFSASNSLRSAQSSIKIIGRIAVASDYGTNIKRTYSLSGGGFFSETNIGTGGGSRPPGLAYSQHSTYNVFSSGVGEGWKSTDEGSTYSSFGGISPVSDAAAEILIPFTSNPNDNIVYFGRIDPLSYDFTTSMDGEGNIYGPYPVTYDFTASPFTPPWSLVFASASTPATWIPGSGWQSVNDGPVSSLKFQSPTLYLQRIGMQAYCPTNTAAPNHILLNGGLARDVPMDGTLYYAEIPPSSGSNANFDTEGADGTQINYAQKAILQPFPTVPANKWGRRDYSYSGINAGWWINGSGYGSASGNGGYTEFLGPINRTFDTPISPSGITFTFSGGGSVGTLPINLYNTSGAFLGTVNGTGASPITVSFGGITNVGKIEFAIFWSSGTNQFLTAISLNGVNNPSLRKWNGSSTTDVSPQGGVGPWKSGGQVQCSFSNSNILTCVAGNADQSLTGVWVSQDGAVSWDQVVAPGGSNPYTRAFISNDKGNTIILVGNNGSVAISSNLGGAVDSRIGNISTSGEIIGIMSI